jgi:HAMP domain-containing protein
MLHNLRIQQRFVAILLLPLVLLAALAAGRIRSNVTEGVRAGRVNTLVIFTITLAGLAHELQKERDLSAVYVGIVALAVILGLLLVMAGSMARPLRQLERAALEVAERRLPGMIERLQRGEVVDPDEEAAPLPMCSRDEIGQVARAFNEAHRVAARVATEHAALRRSIGDLFYNPARRSQGLVDRQLVPLIAANSSALMSAAQYLADNR